MSCAEVFDPRRRDGPDRQLPGRYMVSILTPVLPANASYLPEAFASLLPERRNSWRWEIQVDGETTSAVPESIRNHPHVRVEANGKWLGPAITRNRALARVETEYVVTLDADDLMEPGGLTALVGALETNVEAEFAWGEVVDFLPDGHSELPEWRSPYPLGLIERGTIENYWMGTGKDGMFFTAMCWRTQTLFELGGWSALAGMEDTALVLAASHRFYGYHIRETVRRYRVHPHQATLSPTYAADRSLTRLWIWRSCNARRKRDSLPPYVLPPDPLGARESARASLFKKEK
jgi:glycosyltransferase involved in cell wall biosynthesis